MDDKKQMAYDILNVINTYAYSTKPEYVKFRVDNGSRGVINAIIEYIIKTYINN